jgi:hypothetical protein
MLKGEVFMSRTLRRLIPSPAMIVALVALVMSLGSSAYALVVTGRTIVNNSVTGKDIRHGSVKGKDIHKHSVRGHDLQADSVGGGAIKESRLKTVPSARSAAGLDMWAVVREDGTALRGRGGPVAGNSPSAVRTSAVNPPSSVCETSVTPCPGNYIVTFGHDVSKCSLQATIVNQSTQHGPSGQIIVARLGSNKAKVRTGTGVPNAIDKESARPFNIAAIC